MKYKKKQWENHAIIAVYTFSIYSKTLSNFQIREYEAISNKRKREPHHRCSSRLSLRSVCFRYCLLMLVCVLILLYLFFPMEDPRLHGQNDHMLPFAYKSGGEDQAF